MDVSAGNPAEQFANEEFPVAVRHLLPSAIRRAYAAADTTIEREKYLATPGGWYQRGDLIMLAASFEIEQLVKNGSLPFDGTWEYFARPTGKHFVLLTKRARITTNQIEKPRKKPRRAIHRNNYAEFNDNTLFDDINLELERKREEAKQDGQRRLLHILHGYQDLSFVHLTYPHPTANRHMWRSPNLMRLPHEISSDLAPAEGPSESPDPVALENLERHLRDTGDE